MPIDFPSFPPCLMTHDFPINAYLLLLLQVVRISCSSLVGNGLDHSIIAPIGSIPYLVIDWIQKIHLMIHTIHTSIPYFIPYLRLAHRTAGGHIEIVVNQRLHQMDLLHASPAALVRGWLCRWPCTYRRHEAADGPAKKFVVSFQMGLLVVWVEPTKMSLVPDLDGTRGTPAISS